MEDIAIGPDDVRRVNKKDIIPTERTKLFLGKFFDALADHAGARLCQPGVLEGLNTGMQAFIVLFFEPVLGNAPAYHQRAETAADLDDAAGTGETNQAVEKLSITGPEHGIIVKEFAILRLLSGKSEQFLLNPEAVEEFQLSVDVQIQAGQRSLD
jgi:hypothetical protein